MLNFSQNYFELFGLPVDYRINLDELALRFRELQKVIHPDRYANSSDQEKRLAMQGATLVNEAYASLKDPLKRAQYLLGIKGKQADGENLTTSDTDFLMQQMELREELSEIKDADDPIESVGVFLSSINQAINVQIAQLAILFESSTEENLKDALQCVYKMQFLNKLHGEAESLEVDLEDSI